MKNLGNTVKIIDFSSEYRSKFYELNVEWIKKFFYIEPFDEEVLSNPEKYIIDKNG